MGTVFPRVYPSPIKDEIFDIKCCICIYFRYNFYTMNFEYDPNKSQHNLEKHGIDFAQAQLIWEDVHRLEIPAQTVDEPRFLVIGRISGKCWSAIISFRGDNIRIISVRRSRVEEGEYYESV